MPQLFDISLPIIQAPMAGVQTSALAIAVCNAGGLGSLPCAMLTPNVLRAELLKIREGTNRPYNVNFFCHPEPVRDVAREDAWRALLRPYYEEFGIDPDARVDAPSRAPFDSDVADVVEEFKPPVVSFHFGLPDEPLLARVRSWGSTIIASATTVDEARWLDARGVDAIIAQGYEAGGHRGMFLSDDVGTQVGTFALVAQIAHAVECPVIATGGIADAAGVRAALELGASAAQVGTAYLLCNESTTSAPHRAALKSDASRTTAVTNVFSGRPARGIVNRLMRDLGFMSDATPAFPLASAALAPLRAAAEKKGSGDFSPMWCGQNAMSCREISAAALTDSLASDLRKA